MKKILIFFNITFMVLFVIYLILFNKDVSVNKAEGYMEIQNDGLELTSFEEYLSKDVVYRNKAPYTFFKGHGKAAINSYEIEMFDSTAKTGDIYHRGQIVEGYSVPFDLRIIKILEESFWVENLEETYMCISFMPDFRVGNESIFSFAIEYQNQKVNAQSYEVNFNKETGLYEMRIKLDNDGCILSSARIRIDATRVKELNGLAIHKSYINQKNGEIYVNKVVKIRGIEYYKEVPVQILAECEEYYIIDGELNENNVIVQFE